MEWLHIIKTIVASYGRNWRNVHAAGVEQIVQWGLCRDTVRPVFAPVLRLAFSRKIGYVHASNASLHSDDNCSNSSWQTPAKHSSQASAHFTCCMCSGTWQIFRLAGGLRSWPVKDVRSSADDQSKCSRLLRLTFTAWPLLRRRSLLVTQPEEDCVTSLESVCVGGYALLQALREFTSVLFEPPTLRARDTQYFSSCKVYIKKPPTVELVLRFISLSFTVFLYASKTFSKHKNSSG